MHKIEITKKDGKKVTYELTPSVKVGFEAEFKTGWRKRLGELQLESGYTFRYAFVPLKQERYSFINASCFGFSFLTQFHHTTISCRIY